MPDLRRFAAAYRLELRLICWHWSYTLLYGFWCLMIGLSFSDASYRTAGATLFTSLLGIIPLITLLGIVLAGVSASRAARTRFDLLEAAYPTGSEIVAGRWFALYTALLAFLIVPLGLTLIRGPFTSFVQALPAFLLETLIVFTFITTAIWLVQVTLGIKRWMYPLFGLVWLGSVVIPAALNIEAFPVALLMAFAAHGWLSEHYSELWGRLTVADLVFYYHLFYLALVGLLAVLVLWQVHRHRFNRAPRTMAVMALGAVIVLLIAGRGYSLEVLAIDAQEEERNTFIIEHSANVALPEDVPYTVQTYDLTLDLSDFTQPQFQGQIEIANRGELPLTYIDMSLNPQLALIESSLPAERNEHWIRFSLAEPLAPGATITFDIAYGGDLWYYETSYTQGRHRAAETFIHPQGVNLPCSAAWYPIPGRIIVSRTAFYSENDADTRNYPDCILDAAARFTLRLENPGGLTFASNLTEQSTNLFSAQAATWADLIGAGSLTVETFENSGIRLITDREHLTYVQPFIPEYYTPALEHFRRFFPQIQGMDVFVIDRGIRTVFLETATPVTDNRLIVTITPRQLGPFPYNLYHQYVEMGTDLVNSLFGVGSVEFAPSSHYVEDISYFLWLHYIADGDPDVMQQLFVSDIPQGDVGRRVFYSPQSIPAERHPVASLLYEIYLAQGEATVAAVLQRILSEADLLNAMVPESVYNWIEEAAEADVD